MATIGGKYRIDKTGEVWSRRFDRPLKPWFGKTDGYARVSISIDGVKKHRLVHHLMLETFVGPRPEGMLGLHRDGDRRNNAIGNLYWGSYTDNQNDSVVHGTHPQASKTHCPQGHEYTLENTRIYERKNGWTERLCRACQCEHVRAFRARAFRARKKVAA